MNDVNSFKPVHPKRSDFDNDYFYAKEMVKYLEARKTWLEKARKEDWYVKRCDKEIKEFKDRLKKRKYLITMAKKKEKQKKRQRRIDSF